MLKAVLKFFNNVQGWFAHIRVMIKNLSMLNTYHQEVLIVCDSLENLYRKYPKNEQLSVLKIIIKNRMKDKRLTKKFNKFLIDNKLMRPEQDV